MKKTLGIGLVITSLFLLPFSSLAASNKCQVVEVDGKTLILECERDSSELVPGDQVKLKTVRKKAASIEGC